MMPNNDVHGRNRKTYIFKYVGEMYITVVKKYKLYKFILVHNIIQCIKYTTLHKV